MKRLTNKVAFITGGSRGMGAAIAQRLAQEGAHVAFTYVSTPDKARQVVDAIEQTGHQGLAIAANNANPAAIGLAVEQAINKFGRIDVLVNNAGIYSHGLISDISLEEFDRVIAINVRAVFVASQAAVRQMPAGGRIITIGSNMAERVAGQAASLYAMSKSALIGLTKGMARDLGPSGITVNLVQPGPIDTDMNPKDNPTADWQRSLMALSDFGNVNDVAGLVAYLASAESKYITAAALTIDGGTNA